MQGEKFPFGPSCGRWSDARMGKEGRKMALAQEVLSFLLGWRKKVCAPIQSNCHAKKREKEGGVTAVFNSKNSTSNAFC